MLSKTKIVHSRETHEKNTDKAHKLESEKFKVTKDAQKSLNVFLDITQIEEFLTSEYLRKEDISNLGCWNICSTYSNQYFFASTSNEQGSGGSRPITALASMLFNQNSSLPRFIKNR